MARTRKPAAMLEFNEWIGLEDPRIVPEDKFSRSEIRLIEICQENLIRTWERYVRDATPKLAKRQQELMVADGVRFLYLPMTVLAIDEESQEFLGGVTNGTIFVEKHARGRGIATNLHICIEENRMNVLCPSHFSSGGYAARRSAHKELCVKALKAGNEVHPANVKDYGLQDLAADRDCLLDP